MKDELKRKVRLFEEGKLLMGLAGLAAFTQEVIAALKEAVAVAEAVEWLDANREVEVKRDYGGGIWEVDAKPDEEDPTMFFCDRSLPKAVAALRDKKEGK